jgi:tyrosyl-DNA phosphodiesterase 2
MQIDFASLPIGAFDTTVGRWDFINSLPQNVTRETLTFATFNTWFGEHFDNERYNAISNLLSVHRPDFIAFQEITPKSLASFIGQQWIRDEYFSSDIDGSTLGDYGVLILSRLPLNTIKLIPLPSFMGRDLLLVEVLVNGSSLWVATVHLESMKYSNLRGAQLKSIFEFLKDTPNVALMGDFNFCSSWEEENDRIEPAYHDIWELLRGNEPGYTEDTSINKMRYLIKGKHKQVRFDRVLLKASEWTPTSIELLGTEPISPEHPDVFPSDHFGLLCQISRR